MFTIHYSTRVAHGCSARDWRDLPAEDVQVVIEWRQPRQDRGELCWVGVTDRVLWTGQDEYDPFGWGVKRGAWMYDFDYHQVWERAAHGH